MCGIAGQLQFDSAAPSPVLLKRMGDAIAHRGPDGEGIFSHGPCGLVHRRLAIIDLSPAGHQPMASSNNRHVLVYNGEVYNFHELRLELEAIGYRFHSQTDSEVVLNALIHWGTDALNRFNGMFSLALWDREEQSLLLARDRYGIKPLYLLNTGKALFFGSEIKAILAHPEVSARLDPTGLVEYMTFQNFLTERTLFKDVQILQAGTWQKFTAEGATTSQQYWDYDFQEPAEPTTDHREYAEELDHLFRQAVSRQLISDVPVSSYLSGGMDSGSITAIAAKQLPDLRTFTVGFDMNSASGLEMAYDERNIAEYMSYYFKTEHYEMVLKAGDMERSMQQLVWHLEEPRVGQSYPNFYAAKLASKFNKVVLAGTGGDELFGGYPWRYYRAVVNDSFSQYIDKYYSFWQRLIPNEETDAVFGPIADAVSQVSPKDIFRDVFVSHADQLTRPQDYINHSLYFEANTFLHGLFVVEDKLSMAHSLESRVPFMDNDLADFAMKLPVSTKLGNLGKVLIINENEPGPKSQQFYDKTNDGKLILRKVMRHYIPEKVTSAIKQGFSAPDASWFRGESIDYVRDLLYSPRARVYDYLDRKTVTALIDQHLSGTINRRLLIWSLLYLEVWLQTFKPGS